MAVVEDADTLAQLRMTHDTLLILCHLSHTSAEQHMAELLHVQVCRRRKGTAFLGSDFVSSGSLGGFSQSLGVSRLCMRYHMSQLDPAEQP